MMGHAFPKTWAKSSVITSPSSERLEDRGHVVSLPDGSTWKGRKKACSGTGCYNKALEE